MSWTEIVLEIRHDDAEALSDALLAAGALSVSVEDADLGTDAEQPLFGEPGLEPETNAWQCSRIVALISTDTNAQELVTNASVACGLTPDTHYQLRTVADQDWVRLTQSQFTPIHIGKNIWVVPSWHQSPDPEALVLELDPGLAFGTGSHPTTRLCMEWLEQQNLTEKSVLDYGCGSGILAIVAYKLGANPVVGVDIDPQAIESAHLNSTRNHSQIDYYLPNQLAATALQAYDVVVANILSGPLQLLAPMLCSHIAIGGYLLLSGVLSEQADAVIIAYRPYLNLQVEAGLDGWITLVGQRQATVTTVKPRR